LRKPRSRETNLTKNVTDLRLLQVAPRVPWPLDTGAKLRNYHLARVLAGNIRVTLAAFGDDPSNDQLGETYQRIVTVPRSESYPVGNMLRGAIGRTPLPLLNYTTPEMAGALERLLAEDRFDLIQIESIHLMNYLPLLRGASNHPLIVCDWHNVESDLMQQYAERERNVARRTYARRTARLMSEAEARALKEFDAHIAVSEVDRKRLQSINSDAETFVIENGVDAAHYADEQSATKNRIVFVGSMDYHANIEGATNFARTVWPVIQQKQSNLRFTIVGRNPPAEVTDLSSIAGIEVTGSVADVRPYYREALAAVVPLNVGGGSRLKILEAMAAGVPVVSTRLGAEGLDVSDDENILLAESSAQLANGILKVSDTADLRARLITGGHALVRARYDWSMLGAKLREQYEILLAGMKRN
jgi:sugar transferase (PEP-CTERM/EpsH1 system associated)